VDEIRTVNLQSLFALCNSRKVAADYILILSITRDEMKEIGICWKEEHLMIISFQVA